MRDRRSRSAAAVGAARQMLSLLLVALLLLPLELCGSRAESDAVRRPRRALQFGGIGPDEGDGDVDEAPSPPPVKSPAPVKSPPPAKTPPPPVKTPPPPPQAPPPPPDNDWWIDDEDIDMPIAKVEAPENFPGRENDRIGAISSWSDDGGHFSAYDNVAFRYGRARPGRASGRARGASEASRATARRAARWATARSCTGWPTTATSAGSSP